MNDRQKNRLSIEEIKEIKQNFDVVASIGGMQFFVSI